MDKDTEAHLFIFLNEIGIIAQLSKALLEARLPKGLVAPHFNVLNHLIRVEDGQTPQRLASAFQVPKTSMTHTLAGLEKGGYVTLHPNPDDGRSKQVWLTDRGRALRNATIEAIGPDLADLAARIDFDATIGCTGHLSRVRTVLDAQRDGK